MIWDFDLIEKIAHGTVYNALFDTVSQKCVLENHSERISFRMHQSSILGRH